MNTVLGALSSDKDTWRSDECLGYMAISLIFAPSTTLYLAIQIANATDSVLWDVQYFVAVEVVVKVHRGKYVDQNIFEFG